MWIALAIIFALLAGFLFTRLLVVGRMLRNLATSAERRESALIEHGAHFHIGRQIERLRLQINALVSQTRHESDRDRYHLRQIETTLGSIREAVLIVDDLSTVRMVNEAARGLLGGDREMTGRRIESLMPSVAFLDYVHAVRNGALTGNQVIELVRGEDHLWFEVTGAVISEPTDRQKMCLFVLHDITKLKALENLRKEFVANVSHELRTPVTVIRGFTDTLVESDDQLTQEERLRFLGKIQRNVSRLSNLLEDLLTLSRLEGRASVIQTEALNLNDIVRDACDNYRERKPAGCELQVILDDAVPVMDLDPMRLAQVLENLMENAGRHARGMTLLSVRTHVEGALVRCSVTDNGCGIPPADVPHLFERFYRVDKGRSRDLGGTGLGLSIVKHIVLQHGGEVFVESKVGQGTTISFTLPLPPMLPEKTTDGK